MAVTQPYGGLVVRFTNQIKGNKVITVGVSIGDFPVEISVMGQNKNLLDKVPGNYRISVIRIVPAHFDHFPDLCAHNKERTAVHARNGVIDDNNFLPCIAVGAFSPKYKLLEI